MAHKGPKDHQTFAEIVKAVPDVSEPVFEPMQSVVSAGVFRDMDGITWVRHGEMAYLEGKALSRVLLDPSVTVIHEHYNRGMERVVVPEAERTTFWEDAQAAMKRSGFSRFYGRVFKSEAGTKCLVVHEDC